MGPWDRHLQSTYSIFKDAYPSPRAAAGFISGASPAFTGGLLTPRRVSPLRVGRSVPIAAFSSAIGQHDQAL